MVGVEEYGNVNIRRGLGIRTAGTFDVSLEDKDVASEERVEIGNPVGR